MRLRASAHHDHLPTNKVVRVSALEEISTPFDVAVVLTCEDANLDTEPFIWSTMLVVVEDIDAPFVRSFHGVVEEAEFIAQRGDRFAYRFRLRPLVHGLAHRVRTRTFQDKDVIEIAKLVLKDAGIPDDAVEWRTAGTYEKRSFCMQWRESELAFVMRLLEEEGIFFWFDHDEATHKMIVVDGPDAHEPILGPAPTLRYSSKSLAEQEHAYDVTFTTRLSIESHYSRDWNFELQPREPYQQSYADSDSVNYERFEYPGFYRNESEGSRIAHHRLKADALARYGLAGKTNSIRLGAGRLFTVDGGEPAIVPGEYLLLSVSSHFEEITPAGGASESVPRFAADFRAIPSNVDYRPPRRTPRPRIAGKESAVVTGPSGEEIHVDELGRIKVHFYFDREGAINDTASFWIRVQQMNIGGSMILPRVGWEVDVGFLDGDPDRPVVLQKLYNQETMPPYEQPANKTQGSMQTATSPGGGSTNEIRLQDGNGGMEFFVHASKDYNLQAGADLLEEIGVDCKEEVGINLSLNVTGNEDLTIGGNQSVSVTQSVGTVCSGSKTVTIGGTDDWGIKGSFNVDCDGARTEDIGGIMNVLANKVSEDFKSDCKRTVGAAMAITSATSIAEAIGGGKTETVGGAKLEIVTKSKAENIGALKTLTCGAVTLKSGADISFSAKGALGITSAGAINEKVGADYTIGAQAVQITAPGGATFKAGGSKLTAKGGTLTIKASSLGGAGGPMLKLKGPINFK